MSEGLSFAERLFTERSGREFGTNPRIVAIINQKGGVGKTTSTVNIGGQLVKAGKRVLVVDLDPSAGLTTSTVGEIDLKAGTPTVYEFLLDPDTNKEDCIYPTQIGFDILPCNVAFKTFMRDAERSGIPFPYKLLKMNLAEHLETHIYDIVFLDCPPSIDVDSTQALATATDFLVPMEASALSIGPTRNLLQTAYLVAKHENQALSFMGIFLTRISRRTKIDQALMGLLKTLAGPFALSCHIRNATAIKAATARKLDVASFDRRSNGAIDYQALTQELFQT